MTHEQFEDLVSAYADGELEAVGGDAAEVSTHLASCASCTARLVEYRAMGDALRRQAHASAPAALRQRIAATLDAAEATAASPWARRRRPMWSPGVLAAAAAVVLAVGLAVGGRKGGDTTAQEVLDSHVRSLAGDQAHLFDVASTDQHTVKPWFSGKLDFAPSVVDYSANGFPLLGGRVDFIDGKRVAALVYGRRQHKINVYEWPGGNDTKPTGELRLGYSMLHWSHAGMAYWAVSDVNPADLEELARNIDSISR